MKIAVDVMGGDYAPDSPIEGAIEAVSEYGVEVILVGKEEVIKEKLGSRLHDLSGVEIVNADEQVEMADPPTIAFRKKKNSSIRIATDLVKEGRAQGLVSAGNTGAVMATAKFVLGTLEGVDRPALAMAIPTPEGSAVPLDVGANVDCKPEHLVQFAIMGSTFASEVLGKENPKVGLLNIGEEETKGNELTRKTYQSLLRAPINFYGNVEGRDVFAGRVEVIVCDGFTGNVILKVSESIAETMASILKEELSRDFFARIGYIFLKKAFAHFKKKADYAEYGGAPLLGIKEVCVICHGRSSPKAIKNAIRIVKNYYENRVNERIRKRLVEFNKNG